MQIEFSLQTAILGSLGCSLILAGTLFYLWRLDPAQRVLLAWAVAFLAQTARMGAQLGVTLGIAGLSVVADLLFAGVALLVWLGCRELSGAAGRPRAVAVLLLLAALWSAFAADVPFTLRTLPLYAISGGLLIDAGRRLHRLGKAQPGVGYGALALLFALLGVHYLDYPFLRQAPWFAPIGFAIAATLMLGIGVVMLVIMQRRQQRQLAELAESLRRETIERRESSERFQALAESSELGVVVADARGDFIYCNPRYLTLSDATPEEVKNGRWIEHVHPDDREQMRRRWQQAVATRTGFTMERRVVRRSGGTLWARAHIVPIRADDGGFRGFVATVEEVTALKEAERALRLSEAKFAGAFHASLDYVTLSDLDSGEIHEVNEAFERMSGWTRAEAIGRTVTELGIWPEPAIRDEAIRRLRNAGRLHEYPVEFGTRDGRRIACLLNASLLDVDGRRYLLSVVRDVSAQRRAEAGLRASEERFRAIFDQAFQFTGILDVDGTLLDANQASLAFVGQPREAVIGKPFWEVPWWRDDDVRDRLQQAVREAAAGRLVRFEVAQRTDGGQIRHIDFSLKPVFDGDGKVRMLIPEGRDITPLKAAEEEARLSERRFAMAFHASPDYITISDIDSGEIVDANEAFERITGWTRTEAVGRRSVELGIWRDPAQRAQAVAKLKRDGFLREFPMALGIRDGSHLDCQLNATPIALGERTLMFAIVRDVTAQKAAAEALRRSEEKFSRIVHYSPAPLIITDAEAGTVVDVNRAWQDLFGYSRDAIVGRSSQDSGLWVDPADRDALYRALQAGGGELDRYECRYRRVDGSPLFALVSCRRFDIGGRPCYLWSITDITLRHRLEERMAQINSELEARVEERTAELRRAQDELIRSEKLAALGALVAGVAHELNTPIGNSVTVASTLHERTQEFAGEVAAGALRRSALNAYLEAAGTASDLLLRSLGQARNLVASFKQVAVDQTSDQRRRFDLREVVGEVLTTLSPTIRKTPFTVTMDIPEGIVLDSYPGPLGQVVTNFVTNALVHAFEGRRQGGVVIRAAAPADGQVTMSVQDDGIGIDQAHFRRIFDPFFTTKLGQGGSGLGLHIVYNIVTRVLGGRIAIDSRLGSGTTFMLTMPLCAPTGDNDTP
ncbi:MAG: PAS domain S-box protein [Rhodocyclaceae bacterium]|nr:PAS domain S-box protein [Rhodocyclaceae bacterium]